MALGKQSSLFVMRVVFNWLYRSFFHKLTISRSWLLTMFIIQYNFTLQLVSFEL